jgi:hypothetical protein
MTENPFEGLAEKIDAAAGPLKRMSAVAAQLGIATIPADAACCCLCSIYEPHQCDGWRGDGLVRVVPSAKVFGMQPAPVEVPVCRACHGVQVRKG